MKTAWLSLFAVGIGCLIAPACTITTSTDDGTGGDDTGGTTASGGAAAKGGAAASGGTTTAKGGAAASGGATASGGSASMVGSGGSGGSEPVVTCDGATPAGTPATSCVFETADNTFCHECLTTNCCAAVKTCYGTNPANQCAFGGPDGGSEFTCYEACMVSHVKANGGDYSSSDEDVCLGMCATPKCGAVVGDATADIAVCMRDSCEKVCFLDPAKN
ncbi:MAG: hypothetical protein QM756_26965 [Polyangiaceae bacterium]